MENQPTKVVQRTLYLGDILNTFNANGDTLIEVEAVKENATGTKIGVVCRVYDIPDSRVFLTRKGPRHPLSPLVESVTDSDSPQG